MLTLCGPERVLVVSTEPPFDLSCLTTSGGGGGISRQIKFVVVNFAEPPGFCVVPPRQSPQWVLLVCEKFAENPGFRVGVNFMVNLKRKISHHGGAVSSLLYVTPPPQ